jgi:hypothetical protein
MEQGNKEIASLVDFVKRLNKKSLTPLLEELENEPSPFSVYQKLSKQDWKEFYGLPGVHIYNELHNNEECGGIAGYLTTGSSNEEKDSILPFKYVNDYTLRINVQYRRFGYCHHLAKTFGVQLNFEDLPRRDHNVNSNLFYQIMQALQKRGVKRLIFDESQRQLGLIEFIAKETIDRPLFILTGTPPHGKNAIDYGGSVSARMARVNLSDLRPPEVKQLLHAIFQTAVDPICVLNFWTIFGGEPYLYQLFAKFIFGELDNNTRSAVVRGEKFPKDLLYRCIDEAKIALMEGGINADLIHAIPSTGVKRVDIDQNLQKVVSQLINRGLLKKIPYFSNSKEFRICWTDYNEGPNVLEKSWARCRGYAMENMIRGFVEEVLHRKLGEKLNLPSNRYELCEYFYDKTDADLLLREKDPSFEELDKNWKRNWVVFNIKTNSSELLDGDSVAKFTKLCGAITRQENDILGSCSLILAACQIDAETKQKLMETWQEFNLLGVYDLDNFFEMLPTPPVRTTNGLHVVERTLEKQRLENTLHATVALSGKYRCGKTTLLKECYDGKDDCIFVELPESEIQPLSLQSSNLI